MFHYLVFPVMGSSSIETKKEPISDTGMGATKSLMFRESSEHFSSSARVFHNRKYKEKSASFFHLVFHVCRNLGSIYAEISSYADLSRKMNTELSTLCSPTLLDADFACIRFRGNSTHGETSALLTGGNSHSMFMSF